MIIIKKILFFIIYLFILCVFINANEFMPDNKNNQVLTSHNNFTFKYTNNINFNDNSKNDTINTYTKKMKIFLYMGIIGSGVAGLGALTTGTGVIFMSIYSWAGNVSYYLQYTGAIMFIAGAGLFIIGLPFMIVGFVMYVKTKKRMNAFINTNNEKKLAFGISIKI